MKRPTFTSREDYGPRFTDLAFWRPYVQEVCRRHGLPLGALRPGLAGTNPVFVVDERCVVKIFTDMFGGVVSAPAERTCYRLLARATGLPAPRLLAEGDLFDAEDGWPWPYLVLELLQGRSLGEDIALVSRADLEESAAFLGRALRALHSIPLPADGPLPGSWQAYDAFLAQQRRACVATQTELGLLPPALVAQIEGYLPPLAQLTDHSATPTLLHGDLNWDHLLGVPEGGRWRPTGIIDFGDAIVGDPLYDLVVLHIGLFRCDTSLLAIFREAYGPHPSLQRDFVRRATALTLLHRYPMFDTAFEELPEARAAQSLEELATLLWGQGDKVTR
jgi:aminoglycoside phosphotransferase (APT) family kinase protein